MRKLSGLSAVIVSLLALCATTTLVRAQTLTCNFFASPSGGGTGLSVASPTNLTVAQTMAERAANNTSSRVICLENGTYTVGTWTLNSADNNETYVPLGGKGQATINTTTGTIIGTYPASNIAFYGINWAGLNGSGGRISGLSLSGSGYTLRWNTFNNCNGVCVYGAGMQSSTFDSNTMSGITPGNLGSGNQSAGLQVYGPSTNDTISHNWCDNNGGACIGIATTSADNDVMSCNLVTNNLQTCSDCGALYYYNGNTSAFSPGVQILNNAIYGAGRNSTKGIYLDDGSSNVLVQGNIVAQYNGAGFPPEFDSFTHGGSNNRWLNNIFQIVPWSYYTDRFGLTSYGNFVQAYQTCGGGGAACGSMGGNIFENNIIFTNGGWPGQSLWWYDSLGTAPTVTNNDYWSATGATRSNYYYTDSNPFYLNPMFTNSSTNNFAVGNSTLISDLGRTPILCQGPLAYGITISGAPTPSVPPVAWWRLNSSSGATAVDSAGSDPGTLNAGAAFVPGGILCGYAASVGDSAHDDRGGYIQFPLNLPASFTLYFWTEATNYAPGNHNNNVALGGEVYNTNGFRSGFDGTGIFSFWTAESGGTISVADTTSATVGTWQQFAITYDGTIAKLYRNGAYVAQNAGTYIPGSATGMSTYGASTAGHFYGLFDQVRVYNYALSAAAITALYATDTRPCGP